MKLSTLWRAYRTAVAMKGVYHPSLDRHKRRARQCDKLEKAIGRRIAAIEASGRES